MLILKRTYFFFSSRRRHTRSLRDWSSDVCSSDLPAEHICHQHLAADPRLTADQMQIGRRIRPVGDHRMTTAMAKRLQPCKLVAVSVEDSGSAGHQKSGEEPFLGGPVMRHVAMIVEMVARLVGKRRRGDRDSVEPELMEPVT